jgi:hypothetical protein
MNALFPIIPRGTPGAACGAPAITAATSPFDLPQKEQRNPRAFIFAIINAPLVTQLHELRTTRKLRACRWIQETPASLSMRDHLVY